MTTNNKISALVNSQVPFFVRNDHRNFIGFLEKYYEYLEQSGHAVERAKNIRNYTDIDLTEDVFADRLYDHFVKLLPDDIMADKALVVKYAKDFFRAKGTENSVIFLLNILLGTDRTSFYYPKSDILRTSDGKWFVEKSIRISNILFDGVPTNSIEDFEKFKSKFIVGTNSKASAIVESIDTYYDRGISVYELKISNQVRDFELNETITAEFVENGITRRLTATTFGGIISSVEIKNGGSGYLEGTTIPVEHANGTGATIVISNVTKGNLNGIGVIYAGAGFVNSSSVLISGGGGFGADANVTVNPDGTVHANSYDIITTLIGTEANTPLSNLFSNLNSTNANSSIASALESFTYANTGPINRVFLLAPGTNFTSLPSIDVTADPRVRSLGILGRMDIVDGGEGYVVGDTIEFTNVIGGYGSGASAEVTAVDGNGTITDVDFVQLPGHQIGGAGYTNQRLPIATVNSATGSNGKIIVTTTLGDGEILRASTDSIGTIREVLLINGGSGYDTPPTLNLKSLGDGTAQAVATIITGTYSYPGRFVNDDGMISAFNYIENKDYYQNFSYVVRIDKTLAQYKKALLDLTHPGGMRLFGEYLDVNEDMPTLTGGVAAEAKTGMTFSRRGTYYTQGTANGSNVWIDMGNAHNFVLGDNVYVEFVSGSTANLSNGQIIAGGRNYANGFVAIANGSGTGANASVSVDANGSIVAITVNDRGQTYSQSDILTANVSNLITYNVASVTINNGSIGYSNGVVTFQGGSGRLANANVSVNSTGAIVSVSIQNPGTGYSANDNVIANVSSLIGYNIASINIANGGTGYSNGFLRFSRGTGFGANANVTVDSQGTIQTVTIFNRGYSYRSTDASQIIASAEYLKTYRVDKLKLIYSGENYSNGYVTLSGGTGSGANARIVVNPLTGAITETIVAANGSGYTYDDVVTVNVSHLITYNIASINIANAGYGYSNGFITFSGGTGNYANASVEVDTNGAISAITFNRRGTGYSNGDNVSANVYSLLTYKIGSVSISSAGSGFANGRIIFEGGSGRDAAANISVNENGTITSVNLISQGLNYKSGETVTAKISQLITFNVANLVIANSGSGYSNGFITFEGGSGRLANANITVNATGAIISARLFANGTGYTSGDVTITNESYVANANTVLDYTTGNVVVANVMHLRSNTANANTPIANLHINFQLGNPASGALSVTLAKHNTTADLVTTVQRGAGNSNLIISLTSSGTKANLNVALQKATANANLTVNLQKGAGGANLKLNLQPEPLNTITNNIFKIVAANTNWIEIQHPNTANIFGTAYAGTLQ